MENSLSYSGNTYHCHSLRVVSVETCSVQVAQKESSEDFWILSRFLILYCEYWMLWWLLWGLYHDDHKVYHAGHSNENVINQRRAIKKSPNSRRIHGYTVFRKHVCGHHGCGCHGHCLWPLLLKPIVVRCVSAGVNGSSASTPVWSSRRTKCISSWCMSGCHHWADVVQWCCDDDGDGDLMTLLMMMIC